MKGEPRKREYQANLVTHQRYDPKAYEEFLDLISMALEIADMSIEQAHAYQKKALENLRKRW